MNSIRVIFMAQVDRSDVIEALLTDGHFVIEVQNASGNGEILGEVDVLDLDSTHREAFYKTLDVLTASFVPADSLVWVIIQDGKSFDLAQSYRREGVATTKPQPEIAEGAPLKVKFSVAGFLAPIDRTIDLWYGMDFNPADLTALAEIGIELTGNGTSFVIVNDRECKVRFEKPDLISETYVIQFDGQDKTIAV